MLGRIFISILMFFLIFAAQGLCSKFDIDLSSASFQSEWKHIELVQGNLRVSIQGLSAVYDAKDAKLAIRFKRLAVQEPIVLNLANGSAVLKKKDNKWSIINAQVFSEKDREYPVFSFGGEVGADSIDISVRGPVMDSSIVLDKVKTEVKGVLFPESVGLPFIYKKTDKSQSAHISFTGIKIESLLDALGMDIGAGGGLKGGVLLYSPNDSKSWHVSGRVIGITAWVSTGFLSKFIRNSKAVSMGKDANIVVNKFVISINGALPMVNINVFMETDIGNISFSWLADISSYAIL